MLYNGKDKQILDAVDKLSKVSMRALKNYDKLKTGQTIQQLNDYNTTSVEPLKSRLFFELVACDDWSVIANWALPYIEKFGPQALLWLWEQYVKPKV